MKKKTEKLDADGDPASLPVAERSAMPVVDVADDIQSRIFTVP